MEVSGQISYGATTFPSDKELLVQLSMSLGWLMNQSECFVEVKNLMNLQGIWPDCPAHNLVTNPHIHINTVLLYFFGC